jgi:probable F420-dependent oxidoreductase
MRFGVHLPTYWDDYRSTSIPVAIEAAAEAAEALGYEGIWTNDLVVNSAAARPGTLEGAQVIEPLVTLAALVHLAPRLRLGTTVLVLPQRHPILVAKQAAALHLLSGGRLILGVGIGHRAEEFAVLGADFAHRAVATDEGIEVLRALWHEPVARYHGRFHHIDDVRLTPRPPEGGPPIWVGGNSLGAIRRTARYGDGWLPMLADLDDFRSGVAALRDLTHGRQGPTIAHAFYIRIEKPDEPAAVRTTTPWMPESFAGSPDAVAAHLDAYRLAGLEYALCVFESEDLDDLLRQMRLFAEQVAPRFTGTA